MLRPALRLAVFALLLPSSLLLAQNPATPTAKHVLETSPEPPLQVYRDHSIRDIEAIGNRNVGCSRGFGNWYGLERQVAMGKQYSEQVESSSKLVKDPAVTEYVNRIAQDVVRNSDSLVPFTIKVIDSDDINAFAFPGGFFYVDSGLILAADNEAEFAGVMAHEIAHVAACHAARGRTRGQLMNMASIPMMMVGGPIGFAAYETLTVSAPFTYLKFSRHFEAEADFLGVQYMYKAGYDPQALTSFFEKVKGMERVKDSKVARAFATHPQTRDRIEKTQQEINTLLPPETQYKVDSSEFQEIKAKLYHDSMHRQSTGRPTLHRMPSLETSPAP
jgi:beta-barrel assembly-enhancing protease